MIHYIISFIVYTFAMVGVLVLGFVVYKKTTDVPFNKKNSQIKIEDMTRLPDRKTLYVINCNNERFLIATTTDKVCLISKLTDDIPLKKDFEEPYQENIEEKDKILKSLIKEMSDKNRQMRGNF